MSDKHVRVQVLATLYNVEETCCPLYSMTSEFLMSSECTKNPFKE